MLSRLRFRNLNYFLKRGIPETVQPGLDQTMTRVTWRIMKLFRKCYETAAHVTNGCRRVEIDSLGLI